MILTSTTQILQIILAAAKTANDCPVTIDYVDFTSTTTTPSNQLSNTNGVSLVTVLSAPAASTQRKVNFLSLSNKDTAAISATIQVYDSSTSSTYVIASGILISVGTTLQYTDTRGWFAINSSGQFIVADGISVLPTAMAVYTTTSTWTIPAAAKEVYVEVCLLYTSPSPRDS